MNDRNCAAKWKTRWPSRLLPFFTGPSNLEHPPANEFAAMSESEDWTIGKLLKWTEDYLSERGSDSARLDAEVLLAHAKQCQRIELYTAFDEVAEESVRNRFRALVKERSAGKPVAYLVQSREFYSLPFTVSPAVLIPRPETEFLVIRLLDLAKEQGELSTGEAQKKNLTIIDVGTGSGIIAICAAIYLPSSRVIAIDSSEDALEIAKQNAVRHNVADRIEFRLGNLLSDVQEKADFIVSNPPYVSESEYAALDPQVRDYEPRQALVGGEKGTELIEELLVQAQSSLEHGGWILMEISPMILEPVRRIIEVNESFTGFRVTQDLAKLARVVESQRR